MSGILRSLAGFGGCGLLVGLTLVVRFLAFIGVSKEPNFQKEKAMVDYNIQTFQDTLLQVLDRG